MSNIDCLWKESGVHSRYGFWRIRVLYCDRQVLQTLLNDVYYVEKTIYTVVFLLILLVEQAVVAVSGVAGRS